MQPQYDGTGQQALDLYNRITGGPARTASHGEARLTVYTMANEATRILVPTLLRQAAAGHPALRPMSPLADQLARLPEVTHETANAASSLARLAQREAALIRWDAEDYLAWRIRYGPEDESNQSLIAHAQDACSASRQAYEVLDVLRGLLRAAMLTCCTEYPGHYSLVTAKHFEVLANRATQTETHEGRA